LGVAATIVVPVLGAGAFFLFVLFADVFGPGPPPGPP
jgi:hypothetical protein